jgi:hypothetical protein
VPFGFLKRRQPEAVGAPAPETPRRGVAFDGLTEDWRLVGRMLLDGRLSDALNKREPIEIVDVQWAPVDGSAPLAPASGLKTVDPYDLIIVLATADSHDEMESDERSALRVHKVSYEVALEVPPYRVVGRVLLHPGSEPDSLLNRSSEMFVSIVEATATMQDRPIAGDTSAILVNRQYVRGVEQVDLRTGERHQKLPGSSMGGVNWTDRSR